MSLPYVSAVYPRVTIHCCCLLQTGHSLLPCFAPVQPPAFPSPSTHLFSPSPDWHTPLTCYSSDTDYVYLSSAHSRLLFCSCLFSFQFMHSPVLWFTCLAACILACTACKFDLHYSSTWLFLLAFSVPVCGSCLPLLPTGVTNNHWEISLWTKNVTLRAARSEKWVGFNIWAPWTSLQIFMASRQRLSRYFNLDQSGGLTKYPSNQHSHACNAASITIPTKHTTLKHITTTDNSGEHKLVFSQTFSSEPETDRPILNYRKKWDAISNKYIWCFNVFNTLKVDVVKLFHTFKGIQEFFCCNICCFVTTESMLPVLCMCSMFH